MADKICYSDKINYKGQEAQLVDADCDGVVSAAGKDGLEIKQASGPVQKKSADAFFKETGLEPRQKFKMSALVEFLGAPFPNFFQFFDPRNETSDAINPGLIDDWCRQSPAQVCSWRTPSGLVQKIFSRGESTRRADLFVEKAKQVMKPFFDAETTDDKAVLCLSESGQNLTSKVDYYLNAAQILYQAYGSLPEMFHSVKQLRADYFEQKTSIENGVYKRLDQLHTQVVEIVPNNLSTSRIAQILYSGRDFNSLKNRFGTPQAVHTTLDAFNKALAQFKKDFPKLTQAYKSGDHRCNHQDSYDAVMYKWYYLIDNRFTITCDSGGLRDGCPLVNDSFTFGPLREMLK